jgi:hypothetical protein
MQYKVIPFTANISRNSNASVVASQLEATVQEQAVSGWQYMQMESVETHVDGTKGCFGFGAQPGIVTTIKVLVFSKP